jgi:hypothetical protein
MNQEKYALPRSAGKIFERLDFFATPGGECGPVLQKKRNVRPECCGKFMQLFRSERLTEKFIQREQRRGGVAAATAKAGGKRNFFLQMNTDTVGDPGRLQKRSRRAVNEILSVRRQRRVVAREFDAVRVALESQPVADIDRVQDGFQFMKTIGASCRGCSAAD